MPARGVAEGVPGDLARFAPARQMAAQRFVGAHGLFDDSKPSEPIKQVADGDLAFFRLHDCEDRGEQFRHLRWCAAACWTSPTHL